MASFICDESKPREHPRRPPMKNAEDRNKVDEIWNLIKREHTAVLVSIRKDGSLDAILMGCVQSDFDGTLWSLTFKDNPRLHEIEENGHVLVSY
jgi:general stress protein 26